MAAAQEHGQRDAAARAVHLSPELMLLSAMLRQALEDARSRSEAIRQEALHFLRNTRHVAYWDQFLALDGRLLREAAALVAQEQGP